MHDEKLHAMAAARVFVIARASGAWRMSGGACVVFLEEYRLIVVVSAHIEATDGASNSREGLSAWLFRALLRPLDPWL